MGHEDWVFSAAWQPQTGQPGGDAAPVVPCLLSASMDRTMMLWRPEASTGDPPSQSSRTGPTLHLVSKMPVAKDMLHVMGNQVQVMLEDTVRGKGLCHPDCLLPHEMLPTYLRLFVQEDVIDVVICAGTLLMITNAKGASLVDLCWSSYHLSFPPPWIETSIVYSFRISVFRINPF